MAASPRFAFDGRGVAAGHLASSLGVPTPAVRKVDRVWYDTFDRPLWTRGLTLEVDRSGGGLVAALRDRDTNALRWVMAVAAVPSTVAELPPGPWQRSLGALLGIRALIPVATARLSLGALPITDSEGKTRAEVLWESSSAGGTTTCAVRVVPLRGYESDGRKVAATLGTRLGLAPLTGHPLELLTSPVVVPGSGLDIALDPGRPVAETTRLQLQSLWRAMAVVEPWLLAPPDTEFLHDYRVALRRSRSVLKQARDVVAPAALAAWRARLRQLQQRTNVARDLDVFLLEFGSYERMVPAENVADLAPLRYLLAELRREEQEDLARYLASVEHRDLRDGYNALLACALPTAGAPLALEATSIVAVERIQRAYRRVVKAGRAITTLSPPEALHELRILGKELRYTLELYGSLFDGPAVGAFVKELKQLQDNLGEFQDSEVHAGQLRTFAARLGGPGGPTVPAMFAVGLLAGAFNERQVAARQAFAARFSSFAHPAQDQRVAALLASVRARTP